MSHSLKTVMKVLMLPFWIVMPVFSQNEDPATQPVNPNVKEIIVICKTHFDIGYTHRVKDLLAYYRTSMIDKALDIMDKTKDLPEEQRFSWTAPGWVMSKVVEDWDGQTPERRQRLDEAFKSGRFVTHAVPFTLESESVFPEVIARGFESSTWVCNKYNLPLSRGAKMTDVPSQGNVLATVLAMGGVKFLHLGCNWPSGYVKYPGLFWWEGPDGSRILTLYSHIYGTSVGLTYPDDWTDHYPRDRTIGTNLIPPADWPYAVWPAIFVTPDNSGPPDIKDIKALFDEAHKLMPGIKIRVGCLEDFADAVLATHPNIPVVKKEAPDTREA
jgi:alpha-mannosidase